MRVISRASFWQRVPFQGPAWRALLAFFLLNIAAVCHAQPKVRPYLEFGQVVAADLEPQGPALTYSQITLGVDVVEKGPRSEAQLSYRYERIMGWGVAKGQEGRYLGFARARVAAVPHVLDIEFGALATQVRSNWDAATPLTLPVDGQQKTQLYSTYAGAKLRHSVGALDAEARYHIGYTHAGVREGEQRPSDARFGTAIGQDARISIGMAPGALPVGWSVSSGWAREDQSSLSQFLTSRFVRGDIMLPVTANLAVTAGVGQNWDHVGEKSASTTGAAPKLLYEWEGRSWDAGLYWRPSPRTSVHARFGRRRNSDVVVVDATWQASAHSYVSAQIYDQEQSFGLSVTRQIAGLPIRFAVADKGFLDAGSACVFGLEEAGGCLNAVASSPRLGLFRARGGGLTWSTRGRYWDLGLGIGALERSFLTSTATRASFVDQSYFGQLALGYRLSFRTSLLADTSVSLIKDRQGDETQSLRTSLSLSHYLSRRWSARGEIGALGAWSQAGDYVAAWGQASLRYAF